VTPLRFPILNYAIFCAFFISLYYPLQNLYKLCIILLSNIYKISMKSDVSVWKSIFTCSVFSSLDELRVQHGSRIDTNSNKAKWYTVAPGRSSRFQRYIWDNTEVKRNIKHSFQNKISLIILINNVVLAQEFIFN
jgi:hypothetical protein